MPTFVFTSPDGQEYEINGPEGATADQAFAILQQQIGEQPSPQPQGGLSSGVDANGLPLITPDNPYGLYRGGQEDVPDGRSTGRIVRDLAGGVVAGIPQAVGAVAGIGSMIPGVHYIADPIREGANYVANEAREAFLSDYQLARGQAMQRAVKEALSKVEPLPEGASTREQLDHFIDQIAAQGGAAAEFLYEDPTQVLQLAAETLPSMFAGGLVGKGVGLVAKTAGPLTLAAVGEGAVGAGAVAGAVADANRAAGVEGYTADRLVGIPAGLATAGIGRLGGSLNPADPDALIAGALGAGRKNLFDATGKGAARFTTRVGVGAGTEALEETTQSAQEQMFTNLGTGRPIGEGVGSEAVFGGAAGGFLGGVAAARRRQQTPPALENPGEVNAEAIQRQQEAEVAAAQEQADADALEEAMYRHAPSFMDFNTYQGYRTDQFKAMVRNPETQEHKDFRAWLRENAAPGERFPTSEEALTKAIDTFTKDVQAEALGDLENEYYTELEDHARFKESVAELTPRDVSVRQRMTNILLRSREEALAEGDVDRLTEIDAVGSEALTPGGWREVKYKADGLLKVSLADGAAPAAPEAAQQEAAAEPPIGRPDPELPLRGGRGDFWFAPSVGVGRQAPRGPEPVEADVTGVDENQLELPLTEEEDQLQLPGVPRAPRAQAADSRAQTVQEPPATAPETDKRQGEFDLRSWRERLKFKPGTVRSKYVEQFDADGRAPADWTENEAFATVVDTLVDTRKGLGSERKRDGKRRIDDMWQEALVEYYGGLPSDTGGKVRLAAHLAGMPKQSSFERTGNQDADSTINIIDERLGPTWPEVEADLVNLLNRGRYQAANRASLDAMRENGNATQRAFQYLLGSKDFQSKLSKNERKVWDYVLTAVRENDADKILSSDGQFATTAIAKALGLKGAGNISNTLTRAQTKAAKALGLNSSEELMPLIAEMAADPTQTLLDDVNRDVSGVDSGAAAVMTEETAGTGVGSSGGRSVATSDAAAQEAAFAEGFQRVKSANSTNTADARTVKSRSAKKRREWIDKQTSSFLKQSPEMGKDRAKELATQLYDQQVADQQASRDEASGEDFTQAASEARQLRRDEALQYAKGNQEDLAAFWNTVAFRESDGQEMIPFSNEWPENAIVEWVNTYTAFDADRDAPDAPDALLSGIARVEGILAREESASAQPVRRERAGRPAGATPFEPPATNAVVERRRSKGEQDVTRLRRSTSTGPRVRKTLTLPGGLKASVLARGNTTADFTPTSKAQLWEAMTSRFGTRSMSNYAGDVVEYPHADFHSRVRLYSTAAEAAKGVGAGMTAARLEGVQGFVDPRTRHMVLIAENIPQGREQAVLLHEVGVHLGLEEQMGENFETLAYAVELWSEAPERSIERRVWSRVRERMTEAEDTIGMDPSHIRPEMVAYAVEEAVLAGVKPSESAPEGTIARWMSDLQSLLTDLLKRIGLAHKGPPITAQELVDLAHAAAEGVMMQSYVEEGAMSDDPGVVANYYTRGRGKDAEILPHTDGHNLWKQGETTRPDEGLEHLYWGPDSKWSKYKGVHVEGSMPTGTHLVMHLWTDDMGSFDDPIQRFIMEVSLDEEGFNVADLTVLGPHELGDTLHGVDADGLLKNEPTVGGGTMTSVSGVGRRDLMQALVEARRRMTRWGEGIVPDFEFNRVTGIAVKSERDTAEGGRDGYVSYNTAGYKYSVRAPTRNKSIDEIVAERQGVSVPEGRIRDYIRNSPMLGPEWAKAYTYLSSGAQRAINSVKFLHDIVRSVEKDLPATRRWMDAVYEFQQAATKIREAAESVAVAAKNLAPPRLAVVNDFIGTSTFYQKWGYDPRKDAVGDEKELWKGKTIKVDPAQAKAWNALAPAEQKLVRDVFNHGARMQKRKQDLAKALGISGEFFAVNGLEGPYAPLKRFGPWATLIKSKEFLVQEARTEKSRTKVNERRLDKMKADPNHYLIQYFDTQGAAREFVDANKDAFSGGRLEAFERGTNPASERAPTTTILEKLLGEVKADDKSGLDSKTKEKFRDIIRQVYVESLDERDARMAGARRLNRAGYNKDMIRSFLTHANAEATFVATMEHGAEINESLVEMDRQVNKDRGRLSTTGELIKRHYAAILDNPVTPVQDRIAAMNSVVMLTTNATYFVQNALQPIISVSKLVGDYGDYVGAWSALMRGYKVANKVIEASFADQAKTALTLGALDFNNVVSLNVANAPERFQGMLRKLQLRQLADVGMQEDLGQFTRFDTGIGAVNTGVNFMGGVAHRLYQVARYVEAYNRVATAVAAFEQANKHQGRLGKLKHTAESYAIEAVEDTQGNFSRMDAPLLMKEMPFAKIALQYRKFQVMMAWFYGNALKKAFRGATPEERLVGRRTLYASLAHTGALSGVIGLPGLSTVYSLVAAIAGGGDEPPEDLERTLRTIAEDKGINPGFVDLLVRGVPAGFGWDMSQKLGHEYIFSPMPYADLGWKPENLYQFAWGFTGPAGATVSNFFRGTEAIARGDTYKGLEYMMPRGVRQWMEAIRYGTDGYTMKNGDLVVDPRNFDVGQLLSSALGLPSTEINNLKWTRGQMYEIKEWSKNTSGRIRREYVEAYRDKDRGAMDELRQEWRDLQDAKDRMRRYFNDAPSELRRQPMSELTNEPRNWRRRERRTQEAFGTAG